MVGGMTQIGYYSRPFWPVYEPRTYLTSSYSGNLGYEFPTALGAKVARPDRPVVCVTGDGGFMYNCAGALDRRARTRSTWSSCVFNDEAVRQRGARPRRVLGRQRTAPDDLRIPTS